jgi:hypothetical protein
MGEIKSALELALEKTKDIQSDRHSLLKKEKREEGMKIVSSFLAGETSPEKLKALLGSHEGENLEALKEGFLKILLGNITLSDTLPDQELFGRIASVFKMLGNQDADNVIAQLFQFLGQYQENKKQLRDNLAERYAQVLAQKEQEIARQTGSPVKLQPEQDPEFMKALQENYKQLRARYEAALKQAKDELSL